MFWQNEEFTQGLGGDIHLDGVVCVVDAVFGRQVRAYIPEINCGMLTLRRLRISKWKKTMLPMVSGRVYGTRLTVCFLTFEH